MMFKDQATKNRKAKERKLEDKCEEMFGSQMFVHMLSQNSYDCLQKKTHPRVKKIQQRIEQILNRLGTLQEELGMRNPIVGEKPVEYEQPQALPSQCFDS